MNLAFKSEMKAEPSLGKSIKQVKLHTATIPFLIISFLTRYKFSIQMNLFFWYYEQFCQILPPDSRCCTNSISSSPRCTLYDISSKKSIYRPFQFCKNAIVPWTGGMNMNTRLCVANRILQLCREKNMSLNALANLSAVPPSTLKSIMNGDSRNPGIVTIKLLCDGWDISLSDFFDTDEFRFLEQEICWPSTTLLQNADFAIGLLRSLLMKSCKLRLFGFYAEKCESQRGAYAHSSHMMYLCIGQMTGNQAAAFTYQILFKWKMVCLENHPFPGDIRKICDSIQTNHFFISGQYSMRRQKVRNGTTFGIWAIRMGQLPQPPFWKRDTERIPETDSLKDTQY